MEKNQKTNPAKIVENQLKAMTSGSPKYASEEEFNEELEKTASMVGSSMNAGVLGTYQATQSPYPSPFLTLSDLKIPNSAIEIFQWCKYTYMFDPLICGAINALAGYPITDISLEDRSNKNTDEDSDMLKFYQKNLFQDLQLYKLLTEIGIDYYLYGNCFVFGEFWQNPTTKQVEWKRITRLNPEKMIIDYNPATGSKTFKWNVPERIKNIIRSKKPYQEYVKIPKLIRYAAMQNKAVVLNSRNVYHFARPADSNGADTGWGTPIVANVLKLIMYRNVLRQAQEAIAREHIVPFRIFYLNPSSDMVNNPNANWSAVARSFSAELMKSVRDPNYKTVSPYPVGVIETGGNGRALMLTSEIEQIQAEILAGMNVPREFLFGGVSYSGGSIALKILENNFATYRLYISDFINNFLIKELAKERHEWVSEKDDDNLITARMADLKMLDDAQKKQIVLSLNSQGKLSDEYLWDEFNIDANKMKEQIKKENDAKLEDEYKMTLERQKQQIKMQMELQFYQAKLNEEYQKKYPKYFSQQPEQVQNDQEADQQAAGQAQEVGQDQVQPDAQNAVQGAQSGAENAQSQGEPQDESQPPAGAGTQVQQPIVPQQQVSGTPDPSPEELNRQRETEEATKKLNDEIERIGLTEEETQIFQNLKYVSKQQRLTIFEKLPKSSAEKIFKALKLWDELDKIKVKYNNAENGQIDMRPLPQQKPPRRQFGQ